MIYKKLILLLKGRSRGTLTLEMGEKLRYSFSCPYTPEGADILLFRDENTFIRLSGTEGVISLNNVDKVQAAALVKDQLFLMTGERLPFNWRRAETSFALKNAPKTSTQAANVPAEAVRKDQSAAAAIIPVLKEFKKSEEYVAPAVINSESEKEDISFAEPAAQRHIPIPHPQNTEHSEPLLEGFPSQPPKIVQEVHESPDGELEKSEEIDTMSAQGLSEPEPAKQKDASVEPDVEVVAAAEEPTISDAFKLIENPDIDAVQEEREWSRPEMPVQSAEISVSSIVPAAEPEEVKEFVEAREMTPVLSLSDVATPLAELAIAKEGEDVQTGFFSENMVSVEQKQEMPKSRPCIQVEEQVASPFSRVFSESVWRRIEYPYLKGRKYYLIGEIFNKGNLSATVLAVPGEYALNPPPWLQGFNLYLNSDDGVEGYWVHMRDATTGNPATIPNILSR